jgi:hypothetical protein
MLVSESLRGAVSALESGAPDESTGAGCDGLDVSSMLDTDEQPASAAIKTAAPAPRFTAEIPRIPDPIFIGDKTTIATSAWQTKGSIAGQAASARKRA